LICSPRHENDIIVRSKFVQTNSDFGNLFRRTWQCLFLAVFLISVSYLFIDRPVAHFVHDHRLADCIVLKWLTYPPPIAQSWAPLVLAALMIVLANRKLERWQLGLAVACVSIILADQFRESLAYVFGRYWPETWINNNPSLIKDGDYGFHPFHGGSAYGSFPSGHAARTLAAASVVWSAWPQWRWACGLASVAVAAGLLGMIYHFVGDIIAGGFVGGIVGMYGSHISGLKKINFICSPVKRDDEEKELV